MGRKMMGVMVLVAFSVLGVRASRAATADDDLAVVRKALQKNTGGEATKSGGKPQWLHIRVEGKTQKKEKVSINVPFAVIEAFGDQELSHWNIHQGGEHQTIRLADVLKRLEAGQQIVEVDSEEETVRVWVD